MMYKSDDMTAIRVLIKVHYVGTKSYLKNAYSYF